MYVTIVTISNQIYLNLLKNLHKCHVKYFSEQNLKFCKIPSNIFYQSINLTYQKLFLRMQLYIAYSNDSFLKGEEKRLALQVHETPG